MALCIRLVGRSLSGFEAEADRGLVRRLRWKASNCKEDPRIVSKPLKQFRDAYRGFRPTLATELLASPNRIRVGRETLRRWLTEEGLWTPCRRSVKYRHWRQREVCMGELGTSIHDWFEGRGEPAVLLAMIDDATSSPEARLFAEDSTRTNMAMIGRYARRRDLTRAIYGTG